MRDGFRALDACVHCGFCLPACPTYAVTGDEADSPRGRIVLMRAVEVGTLAADDPGLTGHLDTCLGCRACEPACPSGVGYGQGLEAMRARMAAARGMPWRGRAMLAAMASPALRQVLLGSGRALRAAGIARGLAGSGPARFALGMLAATAPVRQVRHALPARADGPRVGLLRGCVMDTLFGHVHDATRRVLAANGFRVVEVTGGGCCGALHAHAGDAAGASTLAARNIEAFADVDFVAVNSAGCGAMMKEYPHHVAGAAAGRLASRVRDVAQLLAEAGPRPGGALDLDIAYDAPCHLQHAQGVHAEVMALLDAIPGVRRLPFPASDRCCGSAGIFSLLEPGMSRAVLDAKIEAIAALRPLPDLVVTGNPGCLMQVGAGLLAAGLPTRVAHPVELLDWSYAEGGVYG